MCVSKVTDQDVILPRIPGAYSRRSERETLQIICPQVEQVFFLNWPAEVNRKFVQEKICSRKLHMVLIWTRKRRQALHKAQGVGANRHVINVSKCCLSRTANFHTTTCAVRTALTIVTLLERLNNLPAGCLGTLCRTWRPSKQGQVDEATFPTEPILEVPLRVVRPTCSSTLTGSESKPLPRSHDWSLPCYC